MSTSVQMLEYENKSGRSGVRRYGYLQRNKMTQRVMLVEFNDGSLFAFMEDIVTPAVFDMLSAYAEQGEGLATYIARERPQGLRIQMNGGSGNGYFPSKS